MQHATFEKSRRCVLPAALSYFPSQQKTVITLIAAVKCCDRKRAPLTGTLNLLLPPPTGGSRHPTQPTLIIVSHTRTPCKPRLQENLRETTPTHRHRQDWKQAFGPHFLTSGVPIRLLV